MSAPLITFADKVQGQALPNPINELFRYLDANEVKTVVNALAALIDANEAEFADYTPLTRIDDDSTTTGLYTAAKLIALLATKADVGSTSTAGKDEYVPGDSYVEADGILFTIVDEETRFYQVLQDFTASNTGDLEGDLVIDEGAGNIQLEVLKGVIIPEYQSGLYTADAVTIYNDKLYRTPSETTDSPADGSPWVVVGFSDALTENYIWIGGSSGVATAIESKKLYVRNVGNVYLDETYMDANYSTDKLGQKTESYYQIVEKTLDGWSIMGKNTLSYLLGEIQNEAPTTGGTVTADDIPVNNLDIQPASLLATLTLEFNDSPREGDILRVVALDYGVTALTLDGNGNTIIGDLTSLTVDETTTFIFDGTNWRKIG